MAGIGFELRRILKPNTYLGLFQAYAYAGIISSGPWVLSILGVLLIGFLSISTAIPHLLITKFQVSVTYLIVGSLCLTGGLQLGFTRYISDRLFEKDTRSVVPNFNGLLLVVCAISGSLGIGLLFVFFKGTSALYQLLMLCGFVALCCVWMATVLLSGLKQYKEILIMYAIGYSVAVLSAVELSGWGTEGLLGGFVLGHFVLLAGMIALIYRAFPSNRFVTYDFLRPGSMYKSLFIAGLGYNFAVWADKVIFWFTPETGQQVVGPLHASIIYDLPVFLAYLSIIPGMAVFLVRIETDFVEYYDRFYEAVRKGSTLEHIEDLRNEMVYTIRQGLGEIVKIQAITVIFTFIAGPSILRWLGISDVYIPLLYVDVIAAALQVLLLALLNIFYYLDKRRIVMLLVLFFLGTNIVLTQFTLHLGPAYFGYGFAVSLLLTTVLGLLLLDQKLERLEYETFMLQ